ncbi:MAG: MGMT family protein, partial [Pseudobdellovibrionaceae bacterium]
SSTAHQLPWHRVLNAKGKISFEAGTHNFRQQKKRLEKEGIEISSQGQLKLSKFQWKKKEPRKKSSPRRPQMFTS